MKIKVIELSEFESGFVIAGITATFLAVMIGIVVFGEICK